MNNASYGRVTAGLIAVWFVFALSASALHVFKTDLLPVALGLAVTIPIVAFLLWFATSAAFRQFALSLNPRTLTFVQSWRVAGFTFLVLYAAGILPGVFALPAGWAISPSEPQRPSSPSSLATSTTGEALSSGKSWGFPIW